MISVKVKGTYFSFYKTSAAQQIHASEHTHITDHPFCAICT